MKMGAFIVLKHSTARDENIKIYFKISHPLFFIWIMKIQAFLLSFRNSNMTIVTLKNRIIRIKFNKIQNPVNQFITQPKDFMNLRC